MGQWGWLGIDAHVPPWPEGRVYASAFPPPGKPLSSGLLGGILDPSCRLGVERGSALGRVPARAQQACGGQTQESQDLHSLVSLVISLAELETLGVSFLQSKSPSSTSVEFPAHLGPPSLVQVPHIVWSTDQRV